jgi:hypothetical protein
MFSMITVLISLSTNGFAGPVEQCDAVAEDWFTQLETSSCTLDSTFKEGASAGCAAIPEEGWKREQRVARKAIYQHCSPSIKGIGQSKTDAPPNGPDTTCGAYLLSMRGETSDSSPPTTSTMGVDQMMGVMGAAVWTCFAPQTMDECGSPSSVQTSSVDLHAKLEACITLASPPLDATIRSLALNSGVLPIIPEKQTQYLNALILEKQNDRLARLKEKTIFQQAQIEEVKRAQRLKNKCLSSPEELKTLEEAQAIRTECRELKALWRGEDSTRIKIEADGTIASRFQEKMRGQCLNTDSLSVSDPAQIDAQLTAILEQTKLLVVIQFNELIQTDWTAAEALLDAHRNHMDPTWIKDAVDQIIEAGG